MYELLFPNWALVPAGGCDQVIRAVNGLRESASHHWLHVRGVVDGDWRTEDEKSSLQAHGILALPVSEVENLYYSDPVIKAVGTRQAAAVDQSADNLIDLARAGALQALRDDDTPGRLVAALALSVIRRRFLEKLPAAVDRSSEPVTVSLPSPYLEILPEITSLLDTDDLEGLIRLVPIRNTALRPRVAKALRFQNYADYEAAARVQIRDNTTLAAEVRALVGPIPS